MKLFIIILKYILWVVAIVNPIAICFLLYKSYNSEYDENITFFNQSLILSCVTLVVLLLFISIDKKSFQKYTLIKYLFFFIGSPITCYYVWVCMISAPMLWKGAEQNYQKKYSITVYQNSLKRKYVYHDDQQLNTDTVVITVKRNGNLLSLKTLIAGEGFDINIDQIPNIDKLNKIIGFKLYKP